MMQANESRRLRLAETEQVQPIYDPLGDEAGLAVLRCPKLSAADKLAWGLLRIRSGSGREQIRITPREVGEHQGVTADAGRQRLKNLREAGLIDATYICRQTGVWTIVVLDPLVVLKTDVRFLPADPQLVLPFDQSLNRADQAPSESPAMRIAGDAPSWSAETEAAESAIGSAPRPSYTGPPRNLAEEPSEEPRRGTSGGSSLPSGLSGPSVSGSSVSRPLTIGRPSGPSLEVNQPEALANEEPRRGTSGGSPDVATGGTSRDDEAELHVLLARRQAEARAASGPQSDELAIRTAAAIGAATVFRMPSPAQQAIWREQWIETIGRRVRDPQLKACVKVKVAGAIVAGELKATEVEEIFAELDKHRHAGTLLRPPGVYFLRAAQALFSRHGLEWTGYSFGGRRKPKPK